MVYSTYTRVVPCAFALVYVMSLTMSAPVDNPLYAVINPCGGSLTSHTDFLFSDNAPAPITIQDLPGLTRPLVLALDRANAYRQQLISDFGGNTEFIEMLERQKPKNFPEKRLAGSSGSLELTELVTQDYEKLAKMYGFVEEARTRRNNADLDALSAKLINVLCEMGGAHRSDQLLSEVTSIYDQRQNESGSWQSAAEHNMEDYKMVNSSVDVLESILAEYDTLKLK